MRKLAILAVILLIIATVLVTVSVFNVGGFRDAAGSAIEGTILAPIRAWSINTWLFLGTNFTYIAAATLTIAVVGGLFMVFIVYGLFWKKLIQQKILHKTPAPSYGGVAPLQSTMSTQISAGEPMQSQPATTVSAPQPVKEEEQK